MSIKQSLLALLQQRPMYGYQLRAEFESRTGATWPLNVGQVYTTLSRLERDGLVAPAGIDGDGHAVYRITDTGRAEVADWFSTPVSRSSPPRDELAIKLAMAVTVPGVDVRAVVQAQRTATLRALQDYTRLKAGARPTSQAGARPTSQAGAGGTGGPGSPSGTDGQGDLAWLLVLDSLVFAAEAEVRWLDHCESRLARAAADQSGPVPAAPAAPAAAPGDTETTHHTQTMEVRR